MRFSRILIAALFIAVFAGACLYVALRIYQFLRFLCPRIKPVPFAIIFCLLLTVAILSLFKSSLPMGAVGKRVLSVLSGYWMGFFLYLLLLFLVADMLLAVGRFTGLIPVQYRPKARFVGEALAILLSLILVIGGTLHVYRFRHPSYEVTAEKDLGGREWKIVLVSDIHLGAVGSERRLSKMVEAINAESPDVVCIAGDIFDSDFSTVIKPEGCAEILRGIQSRFGVYACPGNHDAGSTVEAMAAFLPQCNITLLDEKSVVIDGGLVLVGRSEGSPIGKTEAFTPRGAIISLLEDTDSMPVVVMDHNPSHVEEYPSGVDLILCGHTHKGQLFPFGLVTHAMYAVDYGLYQRDASSPVCIVTSGAGLWGPPMRIGSDCEIVTVRLTERNK